MPIDEVNQQEPEFQVLLNKLGQASLAEVQAILDRREVVEPEAELSPEIIAHFQQRVRDASNGLE